MKADDRRIYTLALHRGGQDGGNPHAHLMFSERGNDGIARSAEQWFKRHNPQGPGAGRGAQEPGSQGRGLAGQGPARCGSRRRIGRWRQAGRAGRIDGRSRWCYLYRAIDATGTTIDFGPDLCNHLAGPDAER